MTPDQIVALLLVIADQRLEIGQLRAQLAAQLAENERLATEGTVAR